jgi:hypothetical protein
MDENVALSGGINIQIYAFDREKTAFSTYFVNDSVPYLYCVCPSVGGHEPETILMKIYTEQYY